MSIVAATQFQWYRTTAKYAVGEYAVGASDAAAARSRSATGEASRLVNVWDHCPSAYYGLKGRDAIDDTAISIHTFISSETNLCPSVASVTVWSVHYALWCGKLET